MTDLVPPPPPQPQPPPQAQPPPPPLASTTGPPPANPEEPADTARVTEIGGPESVDVGEHPWATVLGVLGLVLVVVLGVVALGARIEDRDGGVEVDQVVLPRLAGRALPDAQAELERLGMIVDVRYEPNELVQEDVVVDQEPIAGARLEVGRQVVLEVSDGPVGVTVPDLSGLSAPEAVRLLSVLGLVGLPGEVFDESVPQGEVVGTLPAAGGRAVAGDEVEIQVSAGPEPRTVPEMVGQPSTVAFAALGRADLQVGGVTERFSADDEPGTVLAVEPGAGAEVPRDTPVRVVVATDAAVVEVPDLVGLTEQSARRLAADVGVGISVATEALAPGDPRGGFVIRQTPVAGGPAAGVSVAVVVGDAPPPPPPSPPPPPPAQGGGDDSDGGDGGGGP